ncbi:hypothetical protein P7K49_023419 [Saguinus oedipus]|uniref:Uncharacterized protein n=1 Tax=Saguinus oedipus TaxID=9490 RepID=A0ABQ9ULL1_SAGOE|nr:hypothetical protein P7K49_023419 [Saguinus oedipus]
MNAQRINNNLGYGDDQSQKRPWWAARPAPSLLHSTSSKALGPVQAPSPPDSPRERTTSKYSTETMQVLKTTEEKRVSGR